MRTCEAAADSTWEGIGGPRCGKPATHETLMGFRCDEHTETYREAMRSSNTLINILSGNIPTDEQIEKSIRKLNTDA